MDGKSLDITEDKKRQLKQLFPEIFSEDQIDFEKLKLILGEEAAAGSERYELSWAGKYDAFKEIQKQTTATLIPDRDGSVNFDTSENIFIEGENLEVLRVLQKSYYGKIKVIYIDPPYNTGGDSFVYPDDFAERLEEYQKRAGIKDEEGFLNKQDLWKKNSKENGQFHSVWLSMMYPRLYLARNLLREDGIIFVSIDDNEYSNLKLLLDLVFGEENFMGSIVRATGQTTGQDSGGLGSSFDYILAYTKNPDLDLSGLPLTPKDLKRFENKDERGNYAYDQMRKTGSNDRREDRPNLFYPVEAPDGTKVLPIAPAGYEGTWRFGRKTYDKLLKEDFILWKKTKRKNEEIWWPYVKYYAEGRTKRPSPLWTDLDGNKKASRDLRDLFDGKKIFTFPKPVQLIKRLIQIVPDASEDDIVLDFFGGSGTVGQAVIELNNKGKGERKFICIQMPEKTEEGSEAYNAGYKTISEIARSRIGRVIERIQKEKESEKNKPKIFGESEGEQDFGFKSFFLSHSNFKTWQPNTSGKEALTNQLEIFQNSLKDSSKNEALVYELILKAGLPLTAKVETQSVEYEGKEVSFYLIEDGQLLFALEDMNEGLIQRILSLKPQAVITLDSLFAGDDAFMTNTHLQLKEAGIDFKVI